MMMLMMTMKLGRKLPICSLLFVAWGAATAAIAGPEVRLSAGKVHAVLVFAETVSGAQRGSRTLKTFFEESTYNTADVRALLSEFADVYATVSGGFEFSGYPALRSHGVDVPDMLLTQSILASNLEDFAQRIAGLMPVEFHARYMRTLTEIERVYDPLIWEQNATKIERIVDQLRRAGERADLNDMFAQASRFYRGNCPDSVPFHIGFYPIPGARGHSTAQSLGAAESVGVLVDGDGDGDDLAQTFGTIFHELCHSLFETQTRDFQRRLDELFSTNANPASRYAYQTLNEGLATALGNGWAFSRLTGNVDPNDWYNDTYVNGFAKALYPIVLSHLNEQRPLDEEFVNEAIVAFDRLFPRARFDAKLALHAMDLAADGATFSAREARQIIGRHFRVNAAMSMAPIDSCDAEERLGQALRTTVLVISPDHWRQLVRLPRDLLDALGGDVESLFGDGREKIVTGFRANGTPFIVLAAANGERLDRGIAMVAAREYLAPQLEVIPIE